MSRTQAVYCFLCLVSQLPRSSKHDDAVVNLPRHRLDESVEQIPYFVSVPSMSFQLLKADTSSRARRGRLTTRHGSVETPVFMPVGTQGSVKTMSPEELKN